MPRRKQLPLVAICGRPNVGKSTLYNRILGKQRAIIHDQEGITRDRHFGTANYDGRQFQIVDTGGIVEAPLDPVLRKMQEQVRHALNDSEVVIFVVDGREELTRTDFELRDELFKLGKPVVLAVNKLDNAQQQESKTEFYELGLGDPIAVSSTHGLGIEQLMDAVVSHLPESHGEEEVAEASEERQSVFIAIVGKPNVGKSSLVNAVLKEERLIVHEEPGTTRDAIDIEFAWHGRQYVLIDTAGMRKKAGIDQEIEYYSVSRSLRAVRRADVCLVLIDAAEGITEQDKRILGYVEEQGKAAILVYTKWDLIEDKQARLKQLSEERAYKIPYFSYMPSTTISSISGQRIFKLFDLVDRVNGEAEKRIPTAELNAFIKDVQAAHKAPGSKGKYAKILYATQAAVKPTTFVLFVNQKRLFHFSYLRYLDNRLRERYKFEGVPIRLQLREGKPQQ